MKSKLLSLSYFSLYLAVSGFYAECIPKRMYVNGSIYTRSKFLGLSLGVHNIGSGQLLSPLNTHHTVVIISSVCTYIHSVCLVVAYACSVFHNDDPHTKECMCIIYLLTTLKLNYVQYTCRTKFKVSHFSVLSV